MISIKGPGLKIFAAILAAIALGYGIYSTFLRSAGFVDGTATIISIEEDPDYIPDPDSTNDVQYIVKATYTVDGKEYTTTLNSYDPSYKVGGEVAIKYEPENPEKMTSGFGIVIVIMIIGVVLLAVVIFLTVKKKVSVKNLKEANGEITYAPSVKGEELAYAENTSQYAHEEDAEEHKVVSKIPVQGFYRVHTREKNLDLLFMILVAMARSGATDERGGSRRMLFNTLKGE